MDDLPPDPFTLSIEVFADIVDDLTEDLRRLLHDFERERVEPLVEIVRACGADENGPALGLRHVAAWTS